MPGSAHASASFMFVPDPAQPSLVSGSTVAAVADLTENGVPDLVLIDEEADSVGVMLGNGAGGFGAPTWYPLAGKPANDVSVADFNNDGHADLLVGVETAPPPTHQGGTIPSKAQILFGDGQGNFTVGQAIALPEIGYVHDGDFTGNGDQDAVVVPDDCTGGANTRKYYMLLGDGHGNLTPGPVYESPRAGGCGSWVGDFTGDGRDDILTQPMSPGEEEAILVLPGEPDGSFGPPIVTPTPELAPYGAFVGAVGDLNGDGKLDVVVRAIKQSAGQVVVLYGNGTGGFTEGGFYPLEQASTYNFDVALGAFAGDGHVDIAAIGSQFSGAQLSGSQLTLFANNGAGVFSDVLTTPLAGSSGSVFVADVNGDGRPDIILNVQSELHIFLDEPASPPSSPSSGPLSPSTKTIAPSVQKASESAKRWRERHGLARNRKLPPVGTVFSFVLNERASVSFSFMKHVRGRKIAGICAIETRGRRGSICTRTISKGTLTVTGHVGENKLTFDGRVTHSTTLGPGSYTIAIVATNSTGHSTTRELNFTIVK